MKLYVAMVGLPARGKSTLAKRIRSGLEQQGIRTAIFNNGELRRMLFGLESGSAEFFNPDNTRAQRLRDQITQTIYLYHTNRKKPSFSFAPSERYLRSTPAARLSASVIPLP